MTPERERLVQAAEMAVVTLRSELGSDYWTPFREFYGIFANAILTINALAAYDAAHPEEAK